MWEYPLKLVVWNVPINEIGVEPHSDAVLSGSHPSSLTCYKAVSRLLFQHLLQLVSMFEAELDDLKHVLDHVVLYLVVNLRIGSKTRHVVDLEEPWLKLVV